MSMQKHTPIQSVKFWIDFYWLYCGKKADQINEQCKRIKLDYYS